VELEVQEQVCVTEQAVEAVVVRLALGGDEAVRVARLMVNLGVIC
jgi:hypothetical protein